MGSKVQEIARAVFLAAPASTAILEAIGDASVTLADIVSETALTRQEAGAWLVDMLRHRVVHQTLTTSQNGQEVWYSLGPEVLRLLREGK